MIITQTSLNALRTGWNTLFKAGLGKAPNQAARFSTLVTSKTRIETYGWLAEFPAFVEWFGPKKVKSMGERAYQLINRNFERTIGVHKHQIDDDNLGLFGPMVSGWGDDAGELPEKLAFEALEQGHERPCYDGQNFFDAEHPVGDKGAVQSNISAPGGSEPWYLLVTTKAVKPVLRQQREAPHFHMVTDMEDSHVFLTGEYLMGAEAREAAGYTYWQLAYRSTQALTKENYVAAQNAIAALTNDNGEPLGLRADLGVFGRSTKAAARALFKKAVLAGGESNEYFEDIDILETERLP